MRILRAIWRGSLARALFVATSCTATPAVAAAASAAAACPSGSLADLARQLHGATRYQPGRELLPAFLSLLAAHGEGGPTASPDGVAVFAPGAARPLVIAFTRQGCLVGVLPARPADLWRAMREQVGPIA